MDLVVGDGAVTVRHQSNPDSIARDGVVNNIAIIPDYADTGVIGSRAGILDRKPIYRDIVYTNPDN